MKKASHELNLIKDYENGNISCQHINP